MVELFPPWRGSGPRPGRHAGVCWVGWGRMGIYPLSRLIAIPKTSEPAKKVEHPWKNIAQPKYRPQLTFCSFIPFFQQLTGINGIMLCAPVLFKTPGFGDDASLMSAFISGGVNVAATFVSVFTVDKFGRRVLFLEGGAQMFICQIAVGVMIALKFGVSGEGSFSKGEANPTVAFHLGLGARWAGWCPVKFVLSKYDHALHICHCSSLPSDALSLEIWPPLLFRRLCAHHDRFRFLALARDKKNAPIEEMNRVWKSHWFWTKFVLDDAVVGDAEGC